MSDLQLKHVPGSAGCFASVHPPEVEARIMKTFGNGGFFWPLVEFRPTTNQESKDPLAVFRQLCRPLENSLHTIDPIRHITMVGGQLAAGNNDITLGQRDGLFLRHSLMAARNYGICVDPEFRLLSMNMAFSELGNFLKYSPPTDMVVVCYVPTTQTAQKGLVLYEDHPVNPEFVKALFTVCPDNDVSRAWEMAAKKAGARFVITFDQDNEISGDHFTGHPQSYFSCLEKDKITIDLPEQNNHDYNWALLVRTDTAARITRRPRGNKVISHDI